MPRPDWSNGGFRDRRHTAEGRARIAEGQRRAWALRARKPKPLGKRKAAELARLIAEQARDAKRYRIKHGPEFWDVYQVIDGREVHRGRRTSEPDWDERRHNAA